MVELRRNLLGKLEAANVAVRALDDDTIVLNRVPVHEGFFNKPQTNLLIQRPRHGVQLFVVCVDEDLQYLGKNAGLAALFASGLARQGWRVLLLHPALHRDLNATLERALAILGFGGNEPALNPTQPSTTTHHQEPSNLLTALGSDLSRLVAEGSAQPTIGRSEELDELASCVLGPTQARLALVVGDSGVGKTNLLHALARRLAQTHPHLRLICLDLGQLFAGTTLPAERENLLAQALREAATANIILALEHCDLALTEAPHGPFILAKALDEGTKLVGTTLPVCAEKLEVHPLHRRLHAVELDEPEPEDLQAIILAAAERIKALHHIEIDPTTALACIQAAQPLPGTLPAKALALLDAAAARAAAAGTKVIGPDDICLAAARQS